LEEGKFFASWFPVTEEELDLCEKLYKQGKTINELEQFFQRSRKTLSDYLKKRGHLF